MSVRASSPPAARSCCKPSFVPADDANDRPLWHTQQTWQSKAKRSRRKTGGEGGIRTPDTLSGMSAFEADRFNHSRTSPRREGRVVYKSRRFGGSLNFIKFA